MLNTLFTYDVTRPLIRRLFLTVGLVIACGTGQTLWAAEPMVSPSIGSATDAVKHTITELQRILDESALKQPDRSDERRQAIEQIIMQRVSYEEMAKRTLGTAWAELPETDRREFVELFVQLLRDNFAGRISEHSAAAVSYLSERQEAHFAEVKTHLTNPKVDTQVDFRLFLQSGEWLVYDVVVDGASIVSNYRAQFTSIIRDVSYVGLVKKMKQNAVSVKLFEHPSTR
ncbi:ABC transporter substrate-binding protein [Nitrospira lenta]|uniref:ABC transporter, auxiliary component, putative ATP-dependent toluene efflux transporter (Modular protein) n=1 Tax=Nitrospira lenta TaxID=1436998 RepID=A0A330L580_9BACT|nr:ABC transporter substrate-binding protein [Nitrospira lenta]SPP64971.1 Putative ABC transporter, auxiliary component, putative ATP-dependent toluene efflux transporter (modular protein) [Nitrospira lenta]